MIGSMSTPPPAITVLYMPPTLPFAGYHLGKERITTPTGTFLPQDEWREECRKRRRQDRQDWGAALLTELLNDVRKLLCTAENVPASRELEIETEQFVFRDSCRCGAHTCASCLGEIPGELLDEYLARVNHLLAPYDLAMQANRPNPGQSLRRALVGMPAPNFWWKERGLRVWWEGDIGRVMRTDPPYTADLVGRIRGQLRYRDTSLVKTATFSRL